MIKLSYKPVTKTSNSIINSRNFNLISLEKNPDYCIIYSYEYILYKSQKKYVNGIYVKQNCINQTWYILQMPIKIYIVIQIDCFIKLGM